MKYCFNPACPNTQNSDTATICTSCGSPLLVGERYAIVQLLGEGGVSRTFLGVDEKSPNLSHCIIKQYIPAISSAKASQNPSDLPETAKKIFSRNAQKRLDLGPHPHINLLLASLEQGGHLYLVQEHIEGKNLVEELEWLGAFSEEKIKQLLHQLLPTLQFIHEQQVIHGDISAENILRRPNGDLVLIDFGISEELAKAGLTRTGSTQLEQRYAPLEQIRGGKAYPASDLYNLGVACIQLLSGVKLDQLYDPDSGTWQWRQHLGSKSISSGLGNILDRLLKDSIKERYQTAAEALAELPVVTSPPPPPPPPPGIGGEIRTLTGHFGWVWSVSFSPDNSSLLASSSSDNGIILWDWENGTRRHTLIEHSDMVLCVAFAGNGRTLASGSRDKNIIIWDAETGQPLRTLGGWFSGHSELVNSLAFSPDGRLLASGSWDKNIILWDMPTGKRQRTLKGHSDWVYSVAFSPDGQTLASGSRDERIILWNVSTGKPRRTLNGDSGLVDTVAFSPDGRLLAGGFLNNNIIFWDLDSGEIVANLKGHSERVNAIAFSPDSKLLASASRDQTIVLWDVASGNPIRTLQGHKERVLSVCFSPDGQFIASGSADGTVKIWPVPL
ncbi:MAG TPA: serine/threonine protein kinase [Oscillatoriaceae cyanobacterium M33_DOE_052]|uniref:Serine/threonine protein kinase n=1 Tax=Planktothricoides sp. SpSt-374 TaxID=2282167 RepID=A0A7C3ZYA4_9CYAN|nr:serine/threonine protein kinase [Oscillatoriaceae cyanobacterium M33_DOE_052]